MNLEIGNKDLKNITKEELLDLIIIEGCTPSLKYFNRPEITDFDNKLFSDTVHLDYVSERKSDGFFSCKYIFFFNFENHSFHYTRDYENNKNNQPRSQRLSTASIKYLIKLGYDIPIY